MNSVCPGCRTKPYPFLSVPEKVFVWLCLCGVTRYEDNWTKKKR